MSLSEIELAAERRGSFIDLTDELQSFISSSGVGAGCCVVFCTHTTCALIVNECEDGMLDDVRTRLETLIPSNGYFAHDDLSRRTQNLDGDEERRNGAAHVKQVILGATSHAIPVVDGEPALGRWQRLLLLELDEPKPRRVVFQVFGT